VWAWYDRGWPTPVQINVWVSVGMRSYLSGRADHREQQQHGGAASHHGLIRPHLVWTTRCRSGSSPARRHRIPSTRSSSCVYMARWRPSARQAEEVARAAQLCGRTEGAQPVEMYANMLQEIRHPLASHAAGPTPLLAASFRSM